MKRLLITLLTLFSLNAAAQTNVTLLSQNVILQYSQTVRLSQLLQDNRQQQDYAEFDLASKLFDSSKQTEINHLKQRVIDQLAELKKDADLAPAAQLLVKQLQRYQYAYRLPLNMDYDIIRLAQKNDPMLPGDYSLLTQPRSELVHILGLVNQPAALPHRPTVTVSDYLSQLTLIPQADPSFAWLISPNGNIEQIGIAYWNREQRTVTPGSVIYLGFSAKNEDMKQLNSDIATLINSVVSPL